jgi:1-acyl-sn-glycerol-3-phosphate acyltransferase
MKLRAEIEAVAKGWRWGRRPLVPESAKAFAPVKEPREFPTAWARTPAAKATREGIQRYLLRPVVWNETRPQVHGLEHLEAMQGPVMLVSNHASHLDAPLVLCSLPRDRAKKTAVGAAADYFFDVWWRSAATALVFNAFPIERAGSRKGTGTARKLVEEGWSLLVFPEGTRSRDGWMQRFRHGASRLAIELELPVVPIAIRGAYAAMPRGRGWPRRGRFPVSVRYGRPIFPEPGEDFRALSRRIFDGVSQLMDEDRTTWWEAQKRAAAGTTPSPFGPQGARWRRIWESTRPVQTGGTRRAGGRRRAWPRRDERVR